MERLCIECKFVEPRHGSGALECTKDHKGFNKIKGFAGEYFLCRVSRSYPNACGPEGKWFEPQEERGNND